jgi:hypothetical protein
MMLGDATKRSKLMKWISVTSQAVWRLSSDEQLLSLNVVFYFIYLECRVGFGYQHPPIVGQNQQRNESIFQEQNFSRLFFFATPTSSVVNAPDF